MSETRGMETAPKDKTILLDAGLPWLVIGIWNVPSEMWVYADLRVDLYEGKWADSYFENEHEKSPIGWLPMPDVQEVKFKQFADELITIALQGCDADGGSIQDLAVALGLLKEVTATEKCGEACACAEVSGFPTQCFRKAY